MPGLSFTSAACPSPAHCIVVGVVPVELKAITKRTMIYDFTSESFSILESDGIYSTPRKRVAKPSNSAGVSAFKAIGLACDSAVQCIAAGDVATIMPLQINGGYQFVTTNGVSSVSVPIEGSGVVRAIPGLSSSTADAITCRPGSGCAAAGSTLNNAGEVPFVVTAP